LLTASTRALVFVPGELLVMLVFERTSLRMSENMFCFESANIGIT